MNFKYQKLKLDSESLYDLSDDTYFNSVYLLVYSLPALLNGVLSKELRQNPEIRVIAVMNNQPE